MISVNPNTMYPLLRELESKGMIEGKWEHPDRRTRRFYEITKAGEGRVQAPPRRGRALPDSVIRSITLIKSEVYGED